MITAYIQPNCLNCSEDSAIYMTDEDRAWFVEHDFRLALNCQKCVKQPDLTMEDAVRLKELDLGIFVVCKDCGAFFVVSGEEIVWLFENGLKMFKRCPHCRRKNREINDRREAPLVPNEVIIDDPEIEDILLKQELAAQTE